MVQAQLAHARAFSSPGTRCAEVERGLGGMVALSKGSKWTKLSSRRWAISCKSTGVRVAKRAPCLMVKTIVALVRTFIQRRRARVPFEASGPDSPKDFSPRKESSKSRGRSWMYPWWEKGQISDMRATQVFDHSESTIEAHHDERHLHIPA